MGDSYTVSAFRNFKPEMGKTNDHLISAIKEELSALETSRVRSCPAEGLPKDELRRGNKKGVVYELVSLDPVQGEEVPTPRPKAAPTTGGQPPAEGQ